MKSLILSAAFQHKGVQDINIYITTYAKINENEPVKMI